MSMPILAVVLKAEDEDEDGRGEPIVETGIKNAGEVVTETLFFARYFPVALH